MLKKIQSIRGMNDILPTETPYWQHVENTLRDVVTNYGYQEIRFPILEHTELFSRTIGEATDIVEKEMYTFLDRNQESLTMRPEGTACCVRAGIQQGLLYNQTQRLWYSGPMFRYERPQKGRFRQFHQFGVETFGFVGPDIDAELLLMAARFWDALKIRNKVTLQINSLGNTISRAYYRKQLVDYFTANLPLIDPESQKRIQTNPLRVLDSKNPDMQEIIHNAPKLLDYLDDESKAHFDGLRKLLDAANLEYEINPQLVRGLDYYCFTVFEWVTKDLGAQSAVCAGGRYDGLVEQMGGKATPACGFALGLERLVTLVTESKMQEIQNKPLAYFVMSGEKTEIAGIALAEKLRNAIPNLRLILNCGGGNFGNQLKRADKSGAKIAIILGENELKENMVTIKYLREEKPQEQIKFNGLVNFLLQNMKI